MRRIFVLLAMVALLGAIASNASAQTCAAAWVSTTAYNGGNTVSRTCGTSQNFVAQYWTQNNDPCTNNGPSGSGEEWYVGTACGGGATPTATARPTATPTGATATPTATATARPSGTVTATPTNTSTPTATATSTGTAPPSGNVTYNFKASYQTVGNDPCVASNANYLTGGSGAYWDIVGTCTTDCAAAWSSSATYNTGNLASKSCGQTGASGVSLIVGGYQFDHIWNPAQRAATYSYADFVTAINTYYPAIGGTGDANAKKREMAAYFANKTQETGAGQYDKELYCNPGGPGYGTTPACNYCSGSTPCGQLCSTTVIGAVPQYWGRHAIQLSWDYNYCTASQPAPTGIGVSGLFADPNQIFSNRITGWRAANWYWLTQLGPAVSNGYGTWPQESAHDAITTTDGSGNYGYGGTIRAINGVIECQSRVQQQVNRVIYYNGTGTDEEDNVKGALGILGYTGGTFGRRFCSP